MVEIARKIPHKGNQTGRNIAVLADLHLVSAKVGHCKYVRPKTSSRHLIGGENSTIQPSLQLDGNES